MAYSINPNLLKARAFSMKLLIIDKLSISVVANRCGVYRFRRYGFIAADGDRRGGAFVQTVPDGLILLLTEGWFKRVPLTVLIRIAVICCISVKSSIFIPK